MDIDAYSQEDVCVILSHSFGIDLYSAQNISNIINGVIRICLEKKVGYADDEDVERINRIVTRDLLDDRKKFIPEVHLESCSLHTFIVVVAREIAMDYIRNAHYHSSSISSIFKAMGVDVAGAEEYLDGLDTLFSPSQKCVLRLRYGEGCDVQQIASMLGVSVAEIRSVEWQAMQRLEHQWRTMRQDLGQHLHA